jgi:hypothetical protein
MGLAFRCQQCGLEFSIFLKDSRRGFICPYCLSSELTLYSCRCSLIFNQEKDDWMKTLEEMKDGSEV